MVTSPESSSSSTFLLLLLPCWFFSFAYMRLLQKAHDFSPISTEQQNQDIHLGSDHNNNFRKDYSSIMADQDPKPTTSSKDQEEENKKETDVNNNNNQEAWLRLSLGRQGEVESDLDNKQQQESISQGQTDYPMSRRDSFLELNLLSGGPNRISSGEQQEMSRPLQPGGGMMMNTPLMFPVNPDEMMLSSWPTSTAAFRRPFVSQSFTSPSLIMPYFGRPGNPSNYTDLMAGPGPGPSSSFRVIDPPRRHNSGIWFILQASQNQIREPFLPQIPKSFLRIKDGKMTVRLLMKYLVNKLRLEHESQVEIRCRGQELEPLLTLQHVRDAIWRGNRDNSSSSSSSSSSFIQISSTSNHLMVLHYGRTLA